MKKYELLTDENGEHRLDMRFRRDELNEIQKDLNDVYPDFNKWMSNSVNRFFFREIVNTALSRLEEELKK
jgi:hypothetical protein